MANTSTINKIIFGIHFFFIFVHLHSVTFISISPYTHTHTHIYIYIYIHIYIYIYITSSHEGQYLVFRLNSTKKEYYKRKATNRFNGNYHRCRKLKKCRMNRVTFLLQTTISHTLSLVINRNLLFVLIRGSIRKLCFPFYYVGPQHLKQILVIWL